MSPASTRISVVTLLQVRKLKQRQPISADRSRIGNGITIPNNDAVSKKSGFL
jgi:hypothetical protein